MVSITRIEIASAFKIGAVLGTLAALIGGVPLFFFQAIFHGRVALGEYSFYTGFGSNLTIGLIILWLVGVAAAFVGGGIGAAILAWVFNWTARWTGGLEIELQGKLKNSDWTG